MTFKKILIMLLICLCFSMTAMAFPLAKRQLQKAQSQIDLRNQMNQLILSVIDMDFMINRDREIDYDILVEDAERILQVIAQLREMDKDKIYKKHLRELERPANKLLKAAQKQDPSAQKYPQYIFNACFDCHTQHREW